MAQCSPASLQATGNVYPPDPTTDTTSTDRKLDVVRAAIENSQALLEYKIDTGAVGITLLRADHCNFVNKVQNAEQVISMIQPQACKTGKGLSSIQEQARLLEERARKVEGHCRRNNIQVFELPKNMKGQDAVAHAKQWVRSILPPTVLSPFSSIEREHQVLARKPPPEANPRPMVIHLLHYRDRNLICWRPTGFWI
ncbi:hypothetical protein NDU88_004756 [Pleurodeles waltl]|uniref:Uncharacterized protein n=1 Tax=Pleurodeles waltl TaxID=8319 RepID=A0AAV7WA08_PLEWA|nr:hypothetical protein NDU88_004756 [Pleurodeles waltl]